MSSPKNGMNTSTDANLIRVVSVRVPADKLEVHFEDGRTHGLPLAWYPRLQHGTTKERNTWQLNAKGRGVHWPLLDEDLSAEGLLAGRRSCEGSFSFDRWLNARVPSRPSRRLKLKPRLSRKVATSGLTPSGYPNYF